MSRQKVYDDPLMAMLSEPAETAPVVPERFVAEGTETFRTLDTSKVNLKEKKSVAKTEPVAPKAEIGTDNVLFEQPTVAAEASLPGLGFTSWDNKVPEVTLLEELTVSSTDCGIFSSEIPSSRVRLESSDLLEKNHTGQSNTKSGGKFKVTAEDNDGEFEDLSVGKIVEREDLSLDFGLFGKHTVKTGSQGFMQAQNAVGKVRREDLELASTDDISRLEETAEDGPKFTSKTSVTVPSTVFTSELFGTSVTPKDMDIAALDLNAYITQNSESQGGLFD